MDNDFLLTINDASNWASNFLNRKITASNISYLIQYGKIKKIGENGSTFVNKNDLIHYYNSFYGKRENNWKDKLGQNLDWHLSFDNLKETDTTKHVHRLHPYKGKFIPQLVEYFLDNHTDGFKKQTYFNKGDIILDPFCGSGTTLVQANELGIHAVGIDVSSFNAFISNIKIGRYDCQKLIKNINFISKRLNEFIQKTGILKFDKELTETLNRFNNAYFPVPEYKYKLNKREIDEEKYGDKYICSFLPVYEKLINQYHIDLKQNKNKTFLDKWYLKNIREEIDFVFNLIEEIKNKEERAILGIILSRTVRSCRATTHSDLATLKSPITAPYYCHKHGKICKPLFTIFNWWRRYGLDTVQRLETFDKLRTETWQYCLSADSRNIDIIETLVKKRPSLSSLVKKQKIKGIFSSPPYVGLIDYHEQHAYAYDLLHFDRKDELEIGPLSKGQGDEAKKSYVKGISDVLINCTRFLTPNYDIFLVANDKFNLYPKIADISAMKIINKYKRPVLNRTERDKGAYSEIIFHLKGK